MNEHDRPGYWNEVYGNPTAGCKVWTRPERFTASASRLLCTLLFAIICLAAAGYFTYQLVKFQQRNGDKEIKVRAEGVEEP
ncbi:MAG: hypothetical protein NTW87_19545 [Planctomycetota bacterium]|nr:hypothetical protein [Planctomycetota bacterium]